MTWPATHSLAHGRYSSHLTTPRSELRTLHILKCLDSQVSGGAQGGSNGKDGVPRRAIRSHNCQWTFIESRWEPELPGATLHERPPRLRYGNSPSAQMDNSHKVELENIKELRSTTIRTFCVWAQTDCSLKFSQVSSWLWEELPGTEIPRFRIYLLTSRWTFIWELVFERFRSITLFANFHLRTSDWDILFGQFRLTYPVWELVSNNFRLRTFVW